jgi:hypothetical protein
MALSKIDTTNMIEDVPQSKLDNNINFRNIIINGDMSIAQRGTSATGLGNGDNGYHTCDRWEFRESGSPTWEFTQTQSTDVPTGQGFAKSLKMDCTTADTSLASNDLCRIQQSFEGQNLQYLKYGTSSAQSTTISFWVKSNKTGNYNVSLYNTDQVRIIGNTYTINSADTWEKKTITFAGDTAGAFDNDNNSSLSIWWGLLGGTDRVGGDSSSWGASADNKNVAGQTVNLADSTSNEWYITGVQLEAGTTASDFEFLPLDVNRDRCQRYYFQLQPTYFVVGRWDTGSGTPLGQFEFLKEMRAAPTFSTTGTFSTGSGYAGTPSAGNIKTKNCYLGGADSIGADQIRYVHAGSDGLIKLNAEL